MAVFVQSPPVLGNQYRDDRFLRELPAAQAAGRDAARRSRRSSSELGELAGGELYSLQLADRLNEPTLMQWDAWGNRIDRIEVTPLWQRAAQIAAQQRA